MSDTKHTPGPWAATAKICDVGGRDFQVVEIREAGDFRGGICHLQSAEHIGGIDAAETRANGALIAAAPELLEALKWLRTCEERGDLEEAIAAADAAIAKAEGRK